MTSNKRHTRCVKSCDLSGSNTNAKQNDHFGKSEGFNNTLTIATKDMNFGYNTNLNKVVRKITEIPKKQLQTDRLTEHLESFDTNEITNNNIPKTTSDFVETQGGVKRSSL